MLTVMSKCNSVIFRFKFLEFRSKKRRNCSIPMCFVFFSVLKQNSLYW